MLVLDEFAQSIAFFFFDARAGVLLYICVLMLCICVFLPPQVLDEFAQSIAQFARVL